jgi:hypothetical protein
MVSLLSSCALCLSDERLTKPAELPHLFEERINKSYEPATNYLMLFYNPYLVILARFVSYIAGAFIAVLLLVSVLNEGVLLFVHISDHNLLWYLGIFTAVFAAARSMIPPDINSPNHGPSNHSSGEVSNRIPASTAGTMALIARADELLEQVASHTHHYPNNWINAAHSKSVYEDVRRLLPYKAQLFGLEIFSVILTPIVLCFSLPQSARAIITFVRDHSKYVDGVGAVCDYSLFDLGKYGNEKYGAAVDGSTDELDRPRDGKLEQSYMNFRHANPRWEGDETARAMEERLHLYRVGKEYDRGLHASSQLMGLGQNNENLLSSRLYTERAYNPADNIRRQNEAAEMVDSAYGDGRGSASQGEDIGAGDDYAPRTSRPRTAIFGSPFLNHIQSLSSSMARGHGHGAAAEYAPVPSYEQSSSEREGLHHPAAATTSNPIHGMGAMVISSERRNETVTDPHHSGGSGPSSAFINTPERSLNPPPTQNRISGGWSREGYSTKTAAVTTSAAITTTTPPNEGADGEIQLVSPIVSRQSTLTSEQPSSSSSGQQQQAYPSHLRHPHPGPASSYVLSSPIIRDPIRKVAAATGAGPMNSPPGAFPHLPATSPAPGAGGGASMIHSALRSFLQQENIDYDNDFYWMTKFKKDRLRDPAAIERSMMNSRMLMSGMTAFTPTRGGYSATGMSSFPFDMSRQSDQSMSSMMMTQSSLPITNPIAYPMRSTIDRPGSAPGNAEDDSTMAIEMDSV